MDDPSESAYADAMEGSTSAFDVEALPKATTGLRNNNNGGGGGRPKREIPSDPVEQVAYYKEQIAQEKAGKRKLFHSMVKLANELRKTRQQSEQLDEERQFLERNWYEGGIWRAPELLPTITAVNPLRTARLTAISLSDLFFGLVIVTAFTRVGVAISVRGYVDYNSLLYFAVFWTIWSKETSYSTRFDTSDLSARACTLITCFAVLFASLSVQAPIQSVEGTRIMMTAAAIAILHLLLHIRVAITTFTVSFAAGTSAHGGGGGGGGGGGTTTPTTEEEDLALIQDVRIYAIYNTIMFALETTVWLLGIFVFEQDFHYRWLLYLLGVVLALRVPRAFLANDFHAACSKRGVLFILLLGFLLQSVVVVASEFFTYQTPTLEHYTFIGATCLMFFCIKLLYVDDSDSDAQDHALLVNRWAGFFFNVGQFCLLLSTTVMGSGLNLLTHSYLAATAALPGPDKFMVCGGFSAILFSIFFIKSMHMKRIPVDPRNQKLFIAAYIIQSLVLLGIAGVAGAMALLGEGNSLRGGGASGLLNYLMNSDIELLVTLSVAALIVVVMSWLDEGVELALYKGAEDSREFRIHPFGFWYCCLRPDVSQAQINTLAERQSITSSGRLSISVLSPLLGDSAARDLNKMAKYDAV